MKKLLIPLLLALLNTTSVYADEPATITIPDNVVYSDIEHPYSIEDIKGMLTVLDDVDGDISDQLYIILNQYSGNETVLGEYYITFAVKDSNQQITRIVIEVKVVDVDYPVFSGINDFIIDINQDPLDFLEGVTLFDNIDGDITASITVDSSEVNYSSYGSYTVYYSGQDSSGNIIEATSTVSIVDLVPPSIIGYSEIYKDVDDILVVTDLLNYFTVYDNIDGNLSHQIVIVSDAYTGNGSTPGDYLVTLKVTDSAGNLVTHDLIIKVREDLPELIYKDKTYIEVPRGEILTNEQIELLLTELGELRKESDYSMTVYKDQYTDNSTTSGEYDYFVRFTNPDGEIVQKEFVIQVLYTVEEEFFEGEPIETFNLLDYWWVVPSVLVIGIIVFAYIRISRYLKVGG